MRLREILNRLKLFDPITLTGIDTQVPGRNEIFMKVNGLQALKARLVPVVEAGVWRKGGQALLDHPYLATADVDTVTVEANTARTFMSQVTTYKRRAHELMELIEEVIGDEFDTRLAFKLPEFNSFAELIEYSTKLNNVLSETCGLLHLGSYSLVGFDNGTKWYDVLFEKLPTVEIIMSILVAAKKLFARRKDDKKLLEQYSEVMKHQQAVDLQKHKITTDAMVEMYKEGLKAQREAFTHNLAKEHLPKDAPPEVVTRIAIIVIPDFADLVERNLDAVPALHVQVRFRDPEEYSSLVHQQLSANGDAAPPGAPQLEAPKDGAAETEKPADGEKEPKK